MCSVLKVIFKWNKNIKTFLKILFPTYIGWLLHRLWCLLVLKQAGPGEASINLLPRVLVPRLACLVMLRPSSRLSWTDCCSFSSFCSQLQAWSIDQIWEQLWPVSKLPTEVAVSCRLEKFVCLSINSKWSKMIAPDPGVHVVNSKAREPGKSQLIQKKNLQSNLQETQRPRFLTSQPADPCPLPVWVNKLRMLLDWPGPLEGDELGREHHLQQDAYQVLRGCEVVCQEGQEADLYCMNDQSYEPF